MNAYGPVPSRRLGQSVGINHIPPKICSYSCVYCQLGRTIKMQSKRQEYYSPKKVYSEVENQVNKALNKNEHIDYLTFVPDGEPTLDTNIGKEIDLLKSLDIKIAVISNASLMWREDVRNDLLEADWVSMKVDAVTETIWRKINRPHKAIEHKKVLDGMKNFAEIFNGELNTETMLIQDLNDKSSEAENIGEFLMTLKPEKAYVALPTRPPAEEWAKPAKERAINRTFQIFNEKLEHVEYLIGYEGNAFAFTGNFEEDLLNITSVHPMREEGVETLLTKAGENWDIVHKLMREQKIIETKYHGKKFYMRKLPSHLS